MTTLVLRYQRARKRNATDIPLPSGLFAGQRRRGLDYAKISFPCMRINASLRVLRFSDEEGDYD